MKFNKKTLGAVLGVMIQAAQPVYSNQAIAQQQRNPGSQLVTISGGHFWHLWDLDGDYCVDIVRYGDSPDTVHNEYATKEMINKEDRWAIGAIEMNSELRNAFSTLYNTTNHIERLIAGYSRRSRSEPLGVTGFFAAATRYIAAHENPLGYKPKSCQE